MVPWREYAAKLTHVTLLPDPNAYADVFDAIEEARRRARRWSPSPTEYESLGQVPVTDDDGTRHLEDFVVCRVPVAPVKTANTIRLGIGLCQYSLWRHAGQIVGMEDMYNLPSEAMLPDAGALLARRNHPTPAEVADVARFLITPHGNPTVVDEYGEPSSEVFRFLEKHVTPPATDPVRPVLVEMARRLAASHAQAKAIRHKSGGKSQTTRFDKWSARLDRLING